MNEMVSLSLENGYEITVCITANHLPCQRSDYLSKIENIDDRRRIAKLRMGCSKLNGHRFLNIYSDDTCPFCDSRKEDLNHFLIQCEKYIVSKGKFSIAKCRPLITILKISQKERKF